MFERVTDTYRITLRRLLRVSLRSDPDQYKTELLGPGNRSRTATWHKHLTRARKLNTHVEAGILMHSKRHGHLRRPRNDIGRPSIHSKSAAHHGSQHTGGSQPDRRLIVDERPSPVPERSHGRSAARSWWRRDAEGRTSAATRQRWARGERTDPMALSSRKGQFTV